MNFLTVALVCAKIIAAPDCSRENALDVVVMPAQTEITCMMQGEVIAAQAGLVDREHNYLKIGCERRSGTKSATALPEGDH